MFNCKECPKNFSTKANLRTHSKVSHQGEKRFKCEECGKAFSYRHVLTQHMAIHTGERAFSCDQCEKKFPQPSTLRNHKVKHAGEEGKKFQCEQCEFKCFRPLGLKEHLMTHNAELRPYPCKHCPSKYRNKRELRNHIKRHEGELDFYCADCDKKFLMKDSLKQHKKTNTHLEKQGSLVASYYSCERCNAQFSNKRVFDKHLLEENDLMRDRIEEERIREYSEVDINIQEKFCDIPFGRMDLNIDPYPLSPRWEIGFTINPQITEAY